MPPIGTKSRRRGCPTETTSVKNSESVKNTVNQKSCCRQTRAAARFVEVNLCKSIGSEIPLRAANLYSPSLRPFRFLGAAYCSGASSAAASSSAFVRAGEGIMPVVSFAEAVPPHSKQKSASCVFCADFFFFDFPILFHLASFAAEENRIFKKSLNLQDFFRAICPFSVRFRRPTCIICVKY